MKAKRKFRLWMALVAAPLVLLVVGVISLKAMFTGDRLKALLIPRLEAATGRTVAIEEISLSVFPSLALAIDGLTIANPPEGGFSSEPFLAVQELRLDVRLLPLLASRLEVTSLVLDRPRLVLEVTPANVVNYRGAANGNAGPDSGGTSTLVVSGLVVRNGSLDYLNHRENSATRVRNLGLDMDIRGSGGVLVITGTAATDSLSYGTVETPLFTGLRVRVDHRMVYDISKDLLTVEQGDLVFQDMRLLLSGTVADVTKNSVLDLSVGSDSLNIADLLSLIPGAYREQAGEVRGTGLAQVRVDITGTLTDSTSADFSGIIRTRGASIQYPLLPKPITDISIVSSFTRTKAKQELRVDSLTAKLGEMPLRASMTVLNFEDPLLNLAVRGALNLATLPEYYPLETGTALGGEVRLDLRASGRVRDPKAMRTEGSLVLRDVSVRTPGNARPVERLNGAVTFSNEVVESRDLTMTIGGSDLRVSWKVRNYLSLVTGDARAPRASAVLNLRSNRLATRDIMSDHTDQGAGSLANGKGRILPGGLVADVTVSIDTLALEKFTFSNVRGSVGITENVLTLRNLGMNAFGGAVVSSGSIDLTQADRPRFDLTLGMNALDAARLLTPFTSLGRRLNGALSMNTALQGALDDTLGLVPGALQGSGNVSLRDGTLTGFRVNRSLAGALGLPDLETIPFRDWKNDFTIEGGRFVFRELTIAGQNARYLLSGSHGLDGTLDYRMTLFLPSGTGARVSVPGFPGEAVELFKDESGWLKFDFSVGGTTDDPNVRLNTEPARLKAEELAKQKLKEKAGDALKRLLKK